MKAYPGWHGFVPAGTEWFIGYLVTKTVVDGHLAFVQIATTLIAASDPDAAYRKAILFGERGNIIFTNK